MYSLWVEWDLDSADRIDYDWVLAAVNSEPDGSGAGMGRRDISFSFGTEQEALDAKARVEDDAKGYPDYKNLTVTVNKYD